jgi:phytoene synthase
MRRPKALRPLTPAGGMVPDGSPPVTLEQSYALCRQLNKRYGTTYYWSTLLLPRVKRHHVHALYGFCRYADDIVDEPPGIGPLGVGAAGVDMVAVQGEALAALGRRFFADVARGRSDDPVLKAVVHTVKAFDIDPECFRRFMSSMTMDLTVTEYETWGDLRGYMDGSAAVVGEMMLPILEPVDAAAAPHARDLGDAFQLTNFLRDVAEDLDRGRIYLPQADLRRFGADPRLRVVTPEWEEFMRFEIARCRRLYVSADIGIGMLPPRSAKCVRAARLLYSRILDVIAKQGYDVFSRRATVPTWQKALVVGSLLAPARRPATRS